VLQSGCLYAQSEIVALGLPILPRVSATRRDRKLGLDRYVHLSFTPQTPLLADKRARGYLHGLLAFDAAVADSADAALLAYNPKSWRHRDDFAPIRDVDGKQALLTAWQQGRYPSAELLIPRQLPLRPHCIALYVSTIDEDRWLCGLIEAVGMRSPVEILVSPERFPPGPPPDLSKHVGYTEACQSAGRLLPPPNLPFD
jgi:hypothetical protein